MGYWFKKQKPGTRSVLHTLSWLLTLVFVALTGSTDQDAPESDVFVAFFIFFFVVSICCVVWQTQCAIAKKKALKQTQDFSGTASTPTPDTFVCDVCHHTFLLKYRHRNGLCSFCAEKQAVHTPSPSPAAPSGRPHFPFTPEGKHQIAAAASQYISTVPTSVAAHKELLQALSAVMDISAVEIKTEPLWNIPSDLPSDMQQQRIQAARRETVLAVDSLLAVIDKLPLTQNVLKADTVALLKAWAVLDYFATSLPAHETENIQSLRDYIHKNAFK